MGGVHSGASRQCYIHLGTTRAGQTDKGGDGIQACVLTEWQQGRRTSRTRPASHPLGAGLVAARRAGLKLGPGRDARLLGARAHLSAFAAQTAHAFFPPLRSHWDEQGEPWSADEHTARTRARTHRASMGRRDDVLARCATRTVVGEKVGRWCRRAVRTLALPSDGRAHRRCAHRSRPTLLQVGLLACQLSVGGCQSGVEHQGRK